MTLLTICSDAAEETGFPAPSTIIGNSDATAKQLLRLAKKESEICSQATEWQILTKEYTFTLATADQDYALPSDFRWIVPSTTWNRDNKRIVINPVTSQEWQFLKGWTTISGLNLRSRIRNNQMEFEQTIAAADNGKTIAYEYLSKFPVDIAAGGTTKQFFTIDTDVSLLDEELITQGVKWRFKKEKGLDWEEDFAEYDLLKKKQMARDGGARTINMGRGEFGGELGVNINDRNYG